MVFGLLTFEVGGLLVSVSYWLFANRVKGCGITWDFCMIERLMIGSNSVGFLFELVFRCKLAFHRVVRLRTAKKTLFYTTSKTRSDDL